MPRYRRKMSVIEAYKLQDNADELAKWCGGRAVSLGYGGEAYGVEIPTLEGNMLASPGDFIIRGTAGEFYPCKPDIFQNIYDEES